MDKMGDIFYKKISEENIPVVGQPSFAPESFDIKKDIINNKTDYITYNENINDIFLKDFTNEDKNIIRLSKTFKFE